MVSLGNQARLLAAQAFNAKVLEDKARAKRAEIEAERIKDLARTTRRLEIAKQNARNVVERQRIQDAINERLRSQAEKDRRAKINAEAERKKAQAFTRVAKGSNIGVLTGFQAKKDSSGRTIGISKTISKTRENTITLLRTEIARQRKIASEGTDLERFLRNEQAINQGRVSQTELRRQIAQRKARGLSQTPAQKRASQGFRDFGLQTALSARSKRKPTAQTATFGSIVSERARAKDLGSSPFSDPLFAFGGRSKKEVVARGGTFGRRVGGQSISDQLSFISSAKSKSTSGRISFAQGLLSNLNFSGSSQSTLLGIVGNKTIKTPKTFQAELREGVGFFTTEAIPVTKAKLTKAERGQLVAGRKAEDFAKSQKAKKEIARQGRSTTQNIFDLSAFGQGLDASNLKKGRAIESQNILAPPRFSLGLGVSVQRQQAQAPKEISFFDPRSSFAGVSQLDEIFGGDLAEGVTARDLLSQRSSSFIPTVSAEKLTPQQRKAQAKARQDETKLIRDTPFEVGGLVRATGSPSSTETFFPSIPTTNIFDVDLSENLGIGDILSPTQQKKTKTKKGKRGKKTQTPQQTVINISGSPSQAQTIDFGFGVTRQRVVTKAKQPAPKRQIGGTGLLDFISIPSALSTGARAGDVSQASLDREILKNLGFR